MLKEIAIALTFGSAVTGVLANCSGQRGQVEQAHLVFGALAALATFAARQAAHT
jgi:hypothetical protein